eukprot:11445485-Alexandrium_andersonii.AAC.1
MPLRGANITALRAPQCASQLSHTSKRAWVVIQLFKWCCNTPRPEIAKLQSSSSLANAHS